MGLAAVDVSSIWTRFPRYGYLSGYPSQPDVTYSASYCNPPPPAKGGINPPCAVWTYQVSSGGTFTGLGLFNDAALRPGGYFEGKVIRLTGKVESWPDREKKGKTIYRICVFDLEQLEVVR